MRKNSAFLLICVMTIASMLIASCQPANPTQPPATQPPAPADTQPPAPADTQPPAPVATAAPNPIKATLTIWDTGTNYFQWVEDIAEPLFKQQYPNVTIVHTGIPYDQFALKIDTASTAGDLPDIIADEVPGANVNWFRAGMFVPLDSYMKADSLNKGDFCGLVDNGSLEGQTYMLPSFTNFWGMLYNKQMFKDAGLPELTTDSVISFDQWLDYSRKLNKPSDKLDTRIWGSQMFRPDWNALAGGFSDPYYLGPDAKTCAGFADTPDMINAWTDIAAAYKDDLTPETGAALLGDQSAWLFFTTGKVGMSYGDASMAKQALDNKIDVGITGQPVVTAGDQMNVHLYGTGYGVTKASKNPDIAWAWVKLVTTVIPLKLAGTTTYGEAAAGIPCYKPIDKDYIAAANNPLLPDVEKMIARFKSIPFTPDYYAGGTAIWNDINEKVIQKGGDVATVLKDSMKSCQKAVDDMWDQWDSLK